MRIASGLAKREVLARGGRIASVGGCQTVYLLRLQSRGGSIFERSARGAVASAGGLIALPDAIFPRAFRPIVQREQFYAHFINKG